MAKQRYEVQLAKECHRPVVASILHESDMHRHEDKELFVKNFCEYCEEMDADNECIIVDTDSQEVVGGVLIMGTRSLHYHGYGASIQVVSSIDSVITNGKILKRLIDQCFSVDGINWVVTYKHLPNGNVLEVYRTKKETN